MHEPVDLDVGFPFDTGNIVAFLRREALMYYDMATCARVNGYEQADKLDRIALALNVCADRLVALA